MDRCGCDEYPSTPFDSDEVRRVRDSYRAGGPDETTQLLLEMIGAEAATGATLLDIGGGIGVIDHELLRLGASRAVLVEASPAYVEAARDEAARAGLLERMEIVAGDFVRRAGEVEEADIVTLDRVVCCYRAADALVPASAAHARKLYGLVVPRDRWYVRWLIRLDNVRWWLKRSAYRAYAHSNARIDERVGAAGLRPRSEAFTAFWRIILYERVGSTNALEGRAEA
jgi:magnesium-protoporphyrin O-methyltransferase